MLKAVIFDFDGTILDTESTDFQCWTTIYNEHGHVLELERYVACVGTGHHAFDPFVHLEELAGRSLDQGALELQRRELFSELIAKQEVLPGVEALVLTAKEEGLRLAVASSSGRDWVEGHLERLGLRRHFEVVRTSNDVKQIKPAPDLYLAALEGLGLSAAEAIAIEDSLNGVKAAKAAGLYTVAVPNPITRGLCFDLADECLASLAEYKLKLERLSA